MSLIWKVAPSAFKSSVAQILCIIALFPALLVSQASAVVLQVNPQGVLTGANQVNVAGEFFDVRFVDGTCQSVFSGCNEDSDFDETSSSRLLTIVQSIQQQVFFDSSAGAFDSDPTKTLGCEDGTLGICVIRFPHQVQSGANRRAVYIQVNSGPNNDIVSGGVFGATYTSDFSTFARINPSTVPVPAGVFTLVSCFGIFGVVRWLQQRQVSNQT